MPLELKQLESLEVFELKIKNGVPLHVLPDCVELIYNKLGFFKVVKLIMIIAIINFIMYVVYTIMYISTFVDFFLSIF